MNTANLAPAAGMGATVIYYTDRKAGTIIEVSADGRRVVWQEDIATRTDANGMSESQSYAYARNPSGETKTFSLRGNGAWIESGARTQNGLRLALGIRAHYHDYSF